jgi:hypothetical protein
VARNVASISRRSGSVELNVTEGSDPAILRIMSIYRKPVLRRLGSMALVKLKTGTPGDGNGEQRVKI